MSRIAMIAAALLTAASPVAAADHHQDGGRTVVQTAIGSTDHTTLVSAVQAAGLIDTLSGAGPFTVFAPTNAAFDRLPDGTVQSLLRPENRAMLQSVLTYHVVPGRVTAANWCNRSGTATAPPR